MPILLHGPYVGLGLWNSVAGTLIVELPLFGAGLWLYARSGAGGAGRLSFWLLVAVMLVAYFGAAFGPPPPNVTTLALTALAMWLLVAWGWWVDRG